MSLSKIFGGAGRKLKKFRPVNVRSPGLNIDFEKVGRNQFDATFTRGEGVGGALTGLTEGLAARSRAFGGLRERVRPGFGDLTRARVGAIRSAGQRTIGNLRSSLRQRRVLGSSFAENQLASAEALFGREEERARAEGVIGEIALESDLIGREFAGAVESAQTLLSQFNFESSLAAGLQQSATAALQNIAIARAQARSAQDAGIGGLLGTILTADPKNTVLGKIGGIF